MRAATTTTPAESPTAATSSAPAKSVAAASTVSSTEVAHLRVAVSAFTHLRGHRKSLRLAVERDQARRCDAPAL